MLVRPRVQLRDGYVASGCFYHAAHSTEESVCNVVALDEFYNSEFCDDCSNIRSSEARKLRLL